jgi:hypothetical protein
VLRTRVVEGRGDAPRILAESDRILARCIDGATLHILEAELDGRPLSASQFLDRFGREGARPGDPQ